MIYDWAAETYLGLEAWASGVGYKQTCPRY
jgi:hypothetical protein